MPELLLLSLWMCADVGEVGLSPKATPTGCSLVCYKAQVSCSACLVVDTRIINLVFVN